MELPAGRTKPWGTGHAVLACKEVLHEPEFAVINADDYAGRHLLLHDFLVGHTPEKSNQFCMAGFHFKEYVKVKMVPLPEVSARQMKKAISQQCMRLQILSRLRRCSSRQRWTAHFRLMQNPTIHEYVGNVHEW